MLCYRSFPIMALFIQRSTEVDDAAQLVLVMNDRVLMAHLRNQVAEHLRRTGLGRAVVTEITNSVSDSSPSRE